MGEVTLPSGDELLVAEEVAERFRVVVPTVRRWAHAGTGPPAIRIGPGHKGLRWRRRDVEAWLDSLPAVGSRTAVT